MSAIKIPVEQADVLVLFGATGDLAKKKLFPALYSMAVNDSLKCPVVGVASTKWNHEQFTAKALEGINDAFPDADPKIIEELNGELSLVVGNYEDPKLYEDLAEKLKDKRSPVIYLAIPIRSLCASWDETGHWELLARLGNPSI